MLPNLSKSIRRCHAHAQICARKSETAFTREMREDFLWLERGWLALARSLFAIRGWEMGVLQMTQFENGLLDIATASRAKLREPAMQPVAGRHLDKANRLKDGSDAVSA
jgi:hypothetical protein